MAKVRVAVNGFGRIGRLTSRYLVNHPNVDLVAINDLTDNKTLAHLFKYDTAQGNFDGTITSSEDTITINGDKIAAFSERNPEALPWADLKVDIVIESTGVFRTHAAAAKHITAGAKKVVISAPASGDNVRTIVLGVNDSEIQDTDLVLSNASCTTNCLAPMVKVLDDNFGIEYGLMTTTHAYTSDQRVQDAPHSDLRRARAAACNVIPTSTGAAIAVGEVLPHLNGKLNGSSMRVPVITGSITELNCITKKEATVEEINALFAAAAEAGLKGILQYTDEPLVSSDIIGNTHSCVFDSDLTMIIGRMIRVVGWYDNEAGYSSRLADLVLKLA